MNSLKSAFATLQTLKTLKYYLSPSVKLSLVNSLIFNRITYANTITFPSITKYWLHKYNTLFKACLSFVYNCYISSDDLHTFPILNFQSRYKLNLLCLTYKALYFSDFPDYLRIHLRPSSKYGLRSSDLPSIQNTADSSFQDLAATAFNSLPADLRQIQEEHNFIKFKKKLTCYLLDNQ